METTEWPAARSLVHVVRAVAIGKFPSSTACLWATGIFRGAAAIAASTFPGMPEFSIRIPANRSAFFSPYP
jgi:hypothetical protein